MEIHESANQRVGNFAIKMMPADELVAERANRADKVAAPDMRALRVAQQVRDRWISASNAFSVERGLPVPQFRQQTVKQCRHFVGQQITEAPFSFRAVFPIEQVRTRVPEET